MKEIERNGYTLHWLGGNAPVQAEGIVDGRPLYFRARGTQWSLEIGYEERGDRPPMWWHVEDWGEWPDAGYMPEDIALEMIDKAVALYREQQPQEIGPDHPEWRDYVLRAWSNDRLGTQPATVLLGIDGDELEKRAIERDLPLNSYHELAKASEAYGRALAAEMAPFNFPAKYDEREREILRLWGMGTLSTDQASRFLYMRPEDMPARARFLRIPAPNEQIDED
ncbi:hypothetical protein ELH43_36720 [Rhizobium ruizarguesonis]|uniref:hypothetical protein n=1 Tax=Rhizobium ruizarguesonis TaxID=2081791 RepID=UPI001031EE8D|nr:hypothetical protein [Rhizobium ruizarguesonis]TBB60684.1 hypothetical protein ELH43_36720 [Rhizobium ruizarguesonis]